MQLKQQNVYEIDFIEIINNLFETSVIDKNLVIDNYIDIQQMINNLGFKIKYQNKQSLNLNGWVDINNKIINIYHHTPKTKQRLLLALALSYQIKHYIDGKPDIEALLLPENGVIDDTDFAHYFAQQLLAPEKLLAYQYGVRNLNELSEKQLDQQLPNVAKKLKVPYSLIDDQLYDLGYFENEDEDEYHD